MNLITSRSNPLIKQYVKLCTSKSERKQLGLFTIEGIKLCLEAFNERVQLQTLLVCQKALEKYNDSLKPILDAGVEAFLISDDVAGKISDTKTPQGVFAICRVLDNTLEMDKIYNGGYYICLCQLQDPANLGAIIRTAEALGVDGVLLSSDSCDIYNPKAVRSTMGSLFRMPIMTVENIEQFLSDITANGVNTYAAVVDKNATSLSDVEFTSPSVVCIGNEGNGLTTQQVDACKTAITIKMKGRAESLNASMAAGIIMHELCK